MKTLQNNFTTPEQSKKLLELGVPKKSADCCYSSFYLYGNPQITGIRIRENDEDYGVLPCWSVGRLIELHEILFPQYKNFIIERDDITLISRMVKYYESSAEQGVLDFSKLED